MLAARKWLYLLQANETRLLSTLHATPRHMHDIS